MNYYNFVTGSPDLQLESSKSAPKMSELLDEIKAVLTKKDMALIDTLRLDYDNQYLLALVERRDAVLSDLALYTQDEWAEIIAWLNDDDPHKKRNKKVFKYIETFYNVATNEEGEKPASLSDFLSALFYAHGMKSSNKFLADWFEFNLNINNILAALTCRKYKWDIKNAIVGENTVANTIRENTTARDFNLAGEIEYFEALNAIAETPNLLDREHKIDQLKWNWLNENLHLKPFSIEQIIAYWIRCSLIHRWDNLTTEQGDNVFRAMLNDLKKDIKFK